MKGAAKTRLGAALAAVALCSSGRASAAASDANDLGLDVSDCPGVSYNQLRRSLSVEMAGRPADAFSGGAAAPSALRIVVKCESSSIDLVANLSVLKVATDRTVSKVTDLTEVPAAHRPRFLAIAIVELMSEPEAPSPPLAEPIVRILPVLRQAPSLDSSDGGARAESQWRFDVAAVALRTSELDQLLWGGLARADCQISEWLVAEVELSAAGSSAAIPLGTAQVLLVSASACGLARASLGALDWDSGVGFRAGAARLAGTPSVLAGASVQSRTVVGPWGGPFVTSRLAAATGAHLSLFLGIEGGYSPARVAGGVDGVTKVAIAQLWTDLSLGFGWRE